VILVSLYPVIAEPPFNGTFHERTTEVELAAPDKVGLVGTVNTISVYADNDGRTTPLFKRILFNSIGVNNEGAEVTVSVRSLEDP